MKKNIFILLVSSLFLVGCQSDEGGNENGGGQNQPPVVEQETLTQEYTKKILTSGEGFHALYPDSGFQFNSEENVESLKNYFDDQLEYMDLITTISCNKLQAREGAETTYLQIGSGSATGFLTWNSDVKIYSVSVEACCYSKYDSYHQIDVVDTNSQVVIDGTNYDLESSKEPNFKTFTKTYDDGVNTFTIENLYQRIFVKSLTITWRG